ncbi:MAG: transposase [Dehalococcoidia bacterium]
MAVVAGQQRFEDEVRYLFYVTNVPAARLETTAVVREANARCHQENLIEQLKNGVRALRMPSDGLLSNAAYLVIASLAWNLKCWLGLVLRRFREAREIGRMEFRRFVNSILRIPCQVVRTSRRLVLRLLIYTPWARLLLEGTEHLKRLRWA